ncbi:MFS transporter [Nonomuraea sp. KM90]|uniref:MFS transporter n=1 Tax=Nonomuraea sp. KM90 TaxID=3457428 RepID=UPI003FCED5F8
MTAATSSASSGRTSLDIPGAVSATAGIGLLIYGLTRGQQDGFTSPAALAILTVAAVLLLAFVLIQRRSTGPLIPPRILSHAAVTGANLAILTLTAVMGAQGFFMMLYMQGILGYSSIETGLAVFPSSLMAIVGSTLATRLAAHVQPRAIAVGGLAAVGVAEILLAQITPASSYVVGILPGYLIFGIGLGAAFVGSSIVATSGIAADDQGVVSGLLNTAQQVGIAVGVAALVTAAVAHTANLPTPDTAAALVSGYRLGLLISAAVAGVGALAILILSRRHVLSVVHPQHSQGGREQPNDLN